MITRVSIKEAEKGYHFFRVIYGISTDEISEVPRLPRNYANGENITIPRVSLAPSILYAVIGSEGVSRIKNKNTIRSLAINYSVYGLLSETKIMSSNEIAQYVPDALHTHEVWAIEPVKLKLIGKINGHWNQNETRFDIWIAPMRIEATEHKR